MRLLQKIIELKKRSWEAKKPLLELQEEIRKQKKKIKPGIAWSKKLLVFLFINFSILEIFIGWLTVYMLLNEMTPDFTPLITFISAVIGETLSYGIYAAKSKAENTNQGIVHDLAIMEKEYELNNKDENVG